MKVAWSVCILIGWTMAFVFAFTSVATSVAFGATVANLAMRPDDDTPPVPFCDLGPRLNPLFPDAEDLLKQLAGHRRLPSVDQWEDDYRICPIVEQCNSTPQNLHRVSNLQTDTIEKLWTLLTAMLRPDISYQQKTSVQGNIVLNSFANYVESCTGTCYDKPASISELKAYIRDHTNYTAANFTECAKKGNTNSEMGKIMLHCRMV